MSIHYDLTFAQYLALPGWNWSLIKLLGTHSPLAVQHARTSPGSGDTASRRWLRAVHCLVLEPHNFAAQFSVFEGTRRGKLYDAHRLCNPDTAVLKPHEATSAGLVASSIRNHPAVAPLLAEGRPEVSITWTDQATGLPCKGRLDWLGPAGFLDLKTLGTTHERQVSSLVARHLYHGQLAHYAAGLRANGVEAPAFLVAAEGKGANDVAVFELDTGVPDGSLHVGAELRSRLMHELAGCVELDSWPGRHPDVQDLCLPSYALLDHSDEITFAEDR